MEASGAGNLKLKDSTVVFDAQAALLFALWRIELVMRAHGAVVVTSMRDGKHSANSLHYSGMAVDIRSKHLTQEESRKVFFALRNDLGPDYDVLLENEGKENEHFHVEADKKVKVA